MRVSDAWVQNYSTGEGWDPVTRELAQDLREARADTAALKRWVADLHSGMYVNCVYCGHRYGPGETTPVSMAAALKAHVEKCPRHPMSQMRDALNGMIGLVQLLSRNEDIPAAIRARMTTSHRFKDAQLCFPETKWHEYGLTAPTDPNKGEFAQGGLVSPGFKSIEPDGPEHFIPAADANNGLPEPSSFPPMPPVVAKTSNSDPEKN